MITLSLWSVCITIADTRYIVLLYRMAGAPIRAQIAVQSGTKCLFVRCITVPPVSAHIARVERRKRQRREEGNEGGRLARERRSAHALQLGGRVCAHATRPVSISKKFEDEKGAQNCRTYSRTRKQRTSRCVYMHSRVFLIRLHVHTAFTHAYQSTPPQLPKVCLVVHDFVVAQQANQAAARSLGLGGEGMEPQGNRYLRGG